MLLGALTLAVSTTVTSCKDYDDDIKNLQEQIDTITSTNPVSTEDMKSAISSAIQTLQTQLQTAIDGKADSQAVKDLLKTVTELQTALNNKADASTIKTLGEQITALSKEVNSIKGNLEDKQKELEAKVDDLTKQLADAASGEDLKKLASDLADAKDELETVKTMAENNGAAIVKIQTDIVNLQKLEGRIQALELFNATAASKDDLADYVAKTDLAGLVDKEVLELLKDNQSIANYVNDAIQTQVLAEASAINVAIKGVDDKLSTLSTSFEQYKSTQATDYQTVTDNIATLTGFQKAIVTALANGGYDDFAAVLTEISTIKTTYGYCATKEAFDGKVEAYLTDYKAGVDTKFAGLETRIKALENQIQSIVYVPEYADGLVQFNTFYAKFANDGKASDWKSVVNISELKVRFRVSPKAAAEELIANFGKEDAKYNIAVDYQKVKTRSTGELFNITNIEAVEGEANLIEVTLDASKVGQSYAVALTVTDNVKGDATALNDITSNYFAAVKSDLYISKVEWASANGAIDKVKKGATIDYKENDGDTKKSYYNVTVCPSIDNKGATTGSSYEKSLSELGISDEHFSVEFSTTTDVTANFDLGEGEESGILTAKGTAGSTATVQSIVTVADPATVGAKEPLTKVYDAKEYTAVKIVSEGTAQTVTLESTDPILWNNLQKSYDIATSGKEAVAAIAAIKTALGDATMSNFDGCTFESVAEGQTIKLGLNKTNGLALIVPAKTTCDATDITTKITNSKGDCTVDVTVKNVTITLPDAKKDEFNLKAIAQTDGTLLTKFAKDVTGKIETVTATRSLKELYSNYADVYKNLVTNVGGTMKFMLAANDQKATTVERGVTVGEDDGLVTVTNKYDGKPIKVTLEGKCGDNVIFAITIPVIIPAENLNGKFDYKEAKKTAFDYAVTDKNTRNEGFDLTSAFVWNDKNSKEVWPTFAPDTYASDAMAIYGFYIKYSLSGEGVFSFEEPTYTGGTVNNKLVLKKATADLSMSNSKIVVTVTATPMSPWGTMIGQAKTITVTVPTWVDEVK